jgi:hypothetical protein
MTDLRACVQVQTKRLAPDGWQAVISLPTTAGRIALMGTIPPGALAALRAAYQRGEIGIEDVGDWSDMLGQLGQAVAPMMAPGGGQAGGMGNLLQMAAPLLGGGAGGASPVQTALGIASQFGGPVLSGLFGGGNAPGVAQSILNQAAAQGGAPPAGPSRTVVDPRTGQVAAFTAQGTPWTPPAGWWPAGLPPAARMAMPGLGGMMGGVQTGAVPPGQAAPYLGAGQALAQAALSAIGDPLGLYGQLQPALAGLLRGALRGLDATAAAALGDQGARDALTAARQSAESRVAAALRIVTALLSL